MSRFFGLVFAACLLAIWTSTTVPAANPDWPKSLFIGTSAPGGVYYIYGEALAQLLTEKLGIATNFTASHGSVHNVELIERGDAQLGTFLMGGWNGAGGWNS